MLKTPPVQKVIAIVGIWCRVLTRDFSSTIAQEILALICGVRGPGNLRVEIKRIVIVNVDFYTWYCDRAVQMACVNIRERN